jgi:ribosome-associated protein
MEISRSEKKRQAKQVEELAYELANLPPAEIRRLPCEVFIQEEILAAVGLKGGAYKRQVKYLAKELREQETAPLLAFLEERRGSQLKEKQEFHELERLREAIITDVLAANDEARAEERPLDEEWPSPALDKALGMLPELDLATIRTAAARYARNRKSAYSKEIFRALRTAQERLLLAQRRANARQQKP